MTDLQGPAVQDGAAPSDTPTWINPDEGEGGGEIYRTILELWREVLKPAENELGKKVLPQWGTRIVGSYPEIAFKDMPDFRDLYYTRILRLTKILVDLIATDDECLKRMSAEEDAQLNGMLYRQIITEWQKQFLTWEIEWDCESETAAIDIATMAEVHKMFFSQEGLITLLDQIGLEFTDADRETLAGELLMMKEAADGTA